jgi:hypothetical protein
VPIRPDREVLVKRVAAGRDLPSIPRGHRSLIGAGGRWTVVDREYRPATEDGREAIHDLPRP